MKTIPVGTTCFLLVAAAGLIAQTHGPNPTPEQTTAQIEALLQCVVQSNVTFIRSGKAHSAEDAAEHLRSKWQIVAKRISTPEQFFQPRRQVWKPLNSWAGKTVFD